MYVRTVYVTGDPDKIDDAINELTTEAEKLLTAQSGYRGMGLFVDREIGKLLVGTWWESEAALRASDEALRERRMDMLATFGQTMTIDNFEAAVARRPQQKLGPGAGFRLTRLEFAPSDAEVLVDADLLVDVFQNQVLPRIENFRGFAGASLLIDRAAGKATVGALYKDRKALAASRGAAGSVRADILAKTNVILRGLEEFEVVTVGPIQS